MYQLFPFTGMKALLKIGNPVSLLRGMVDLFFAKVLGKNLMQRMIGEAYLKVPARRTERLVLNPIYLRLFHS